ncbi:hypothetical protein METH_23060 (plasmid) [Leisingera methylohalidivorans DSM 14336]|uniref:Uncharacterized protein n=1 Tax=Leisingera methylohalidivorans DSM 14336 TaxID=999552 RepID=V9W149_9RHOB|nr:hypothetical protein METH_23060 [Leisingera methylohalidivorans DSM 14336]
MTSALPITKINEGSKMPAKSKQLSTLAGVAIPETEIPIPNIRPMA